MRIFSFVAAALLAGTLHADPAGAQVSPTDIQAGFPAGEPRYAVQVVPAGTPVRLMFLKEITSRTGFAGQHFKMRVDEPVYIDGKPVIPVGTSAWGEIVSVDTNGAVGRRGKLGIRILFLDLPQGRLPLKGYANDKGGGNGAGLALAIIGFGLFGLFTQGDSARFKGGEMITVYVDNAVGAEPKAEPIPSEPGTTGISSTGPRALIIEQMPAEPSSP